MFSGHVKNIKSQPQDTADGLTTESDKITTYRILWTRDPSYKQVGDIIVIFSSTLLEKSNGKGQSNADLESKYGNLSRYLWNIVIFIFRTIKFGTN